MSDPTTTPLTTEKFQALRDNWRDSQPMTVTCAFCDWWIFEGTAGEGRKAAADHRAELHPAAKNRTGRRRKTGWKKDSSEQATLDRVEANRVRAEREDAERLAKIERGRLLSVVAPAAAAVSPDLSLPLGVREALARPDYRAEWDRARRAGGAAA